MGKIENIYETPIYNTNIWETDTYEQQSNMYNGS